MKIRGLPPEVYRLGWVSFFTDISTEILYPIVPLFLTTVIGAPVSAVGLIEGSAEGLASLLKGWMGRWSDRAGSRRPFVFWGYVLSAVAKPLLALASGWGFVLFARCLDRVGKSARSAPRDAMLADSVSVRQRGRAFGLHRAMDTAGAVLGPLLALALLSRWGFASDLRRFFLVAFIPGIGGALLVLGVREAKRGTPVKEARVTPDPMVARKAPQFGRYLAAWGLFSLGNSSDMFLILRAREVGFTADRIVLTYAFYNVVYALGSAYLGELSDRIGRRPILIGGLVVFAAVYLGFATAHSPVILVGLFGVYGLYIAATDGVGKAFAVDLLPDSGRAAGLGKLATITGVGALVASGVAGALWTRFGSVWAFGYGAAAALASACVLLFFVRAEAIDQGRGSPPSP